MPLQSKNFLALKLTSLLSAGLLSVAAMPALGVQTQNAITGLMDDSDSNCPAPVPAFNQDDCSYNASNPTHATISEWIGPLFNAGYYAPGDSPGPALATANDPVPGDGKTPPAISGSVTIDDRGTADGADDTIDATIVIGQTVRNFGAGARGTAEETWTSMTMRLAPLPVPPAVAIAGPVTVSSATPNASGGFDYVIGSLGLPPPLVDAATGTDFWPSESGPDSDHAVGVGHFWAGPETVGIAPIEPGASIGSSAVFATSGYSCIDTDGITGGPGDGIGGAATACDAKGRMGDGTNGGGGPLENVLLALSTDGSRNITGARMIWVQQQDVIFPAGPDSWVAGVIEFTGVQRDCGVAGIATDDSYTISHDSIDNPLNVGANDTLIADPATATICAPPDHGGTATIENSPGIPTEITVNYTPLPGFTGTETFQYTVADGTVTARGIVTIEVAFLRAVNDQVNIIEGDTVTINVIANDSAGTGPLASHTVAITRPPNVGTATVIGNEISYVSVAGSHGNDNFEYTLTDAEGEVSEPGTVQVGIGVDRQPVPAGGVSAFGLWNLMLLCGALLRRGARRAYVNTAIAE